MLKFKTLNIILILLLLIEVLLVYFLNITAYIFIPMVLGYLTIIIYGSAMICSGLYTNSYCFADNNNREIALSFDDGPNEEITPKVLNLLEKHKIEAVFFVIGAKTHNQKRLLKQISEKNHIIGNHSYSHSNMIGIYNKKRVIAEITRTDKEIKEVISKTPKLYRPPFGVTNPQIAGAIKKTGKISIGWNIRSMDTTKRSNKKVCNRVFKKLKPGSILLFHDNNSRIPDILEEVILHALNSGYTFKRLDKMINIKAYE